MTRIQRIEKALFAVKSDVRRGRGVRMRDLTKHYPNTYFWQAVHKIGLIENSGIDSKPNWKWVGGRIVKGDVKFIEDFMYNKEKQRQLSYDQRTRN